MAKLSCCACCRGALEPAQQLRFLVETDSLDNPLYLSRIRSLPSVNGRPIPVCKTCQSELEANPAALKLRLKAPLSLTTGLLGALGVLSVGWLLGNLFTSRG